MSAQLTAVVAVTMVEYALIPKFASAQATGKGSTAMSVSLVCITG